VRDLILVKAFGGHWHTRGSSTGCYDGLVKAILRLPRPATYADYLAAEQTSEGRHEFIDGVIVVMAGGSDEHNALSASSDSSPSGA
jgi:hypothetical protein